MRTNIPKGLIAFVLAVLATASQAITVLSFTGAPRSWVGAGQTVTVTDASFVFTARRNFDNGVSLAINDFSINPDFQQTRWWSLDFAAPFDRPLATGSYQDATRWPFQAPGAPGLNFSGNGRGNNTLTGSFVVLDIQFGFDESVLSYAADFVQYDEGIREWWNVGSIRYNSLIPITPIPEPETVVLLGAGLALTAVWKRRRRTS